MLSNRIRQLAQDYVTVHRAQRQDPTSDELGVRVAEMYDRFVAQLETEGFRYADNEDVIRIASGIVSETFDVRYHRCGHAVVRDGETLRIHGGRLSGHVIDRCPGCQQRLDVFDLYANPGGVARDLLREAGLYPTADGLILVREPERRASILHELHESLGKLEDGDLVAVYGVVFALMRDSANG